eukprot:CAMPEP_0196572252 /NCGR_PEP_ID=MMETSP1081-20130531/2341_1 /TAXON_ID=36882 /ORGANISM="Pyramimonas amylifera, Strain CCMP720" /LENGTH=228 /DNA_ID=CAMNT_0041889511 /DNA_START=267 /DNA_END=953 /DNA_ORIENTATION=-
MVQYEIQPPLGQEWFLDQSRVDEIVDALWAGDFNLDPVFEPSKVLKITIPVVAGTSAPSSTSGSSTNVALIVGVVLGVLALLFAVVALVAVHYRSQIREKLLSQDTSQFKSGDAKVHPISDDDYISAPEVAVLPLTEALVNPSNTAEAVPSDAEPLIEEAPLEVTVETNQGETFDGKEDVGNQDQNSEMNGKQEDETDVFNVGHRRSILRPDPLVPAQRSSSDNKSEI